MGRRWGFLVVAAAPSAGPSSLYSMESTLHLSRRQLWWVQLQEPKARESLVLLVLKNS